MKALRTALDLTQKRLADTLGCDHSLISQAESGKPLGAITTKSICDAYRAEMARLGLTAEDFLRGYRGGARSPLSGPPGASGNAA